MTRRWFISYTYRYVDMLGVVVEQGQNNVVTDVSPAKWIAESQAALGGERWVNYAEEISLGLAAELTVGGAGVPSAYLERGE